MNCEDVLIRLEETEDPAKLPDTARAHLASCSACAEYARLLKPGGDVLREALSQPPDAAAFARVKAGVAAKLDRRGRAGLRRERAVPASVWTPFRISVAAAAAVVLAVGGYFLISPKATPKNDGGSEVAQNPPENKAASERLEKLQDQVQKQYLLEELAILEGALNDKADANAKSLAQDAELYVERILTLKAKDPARAREILGGIRSAQIAQRLQDVRNKLGPDAGDTVTRPLDLAFAALNEATQISELEGGRDAN